MIAPRLTPQGKVAHAVADDLVQVVAALRPKVAAASAAADEDGSVVFVNDGEVAVILAREQADLLLFRLVEAARLVRSLASERLIEPPGGAP